MATKYYALLTNIGAAKLANATALGEQVEITQMAVGDGNGALPTPNPAQTALVHELRRAPLNTLTIDPVNTNQIITEQVIPEDVGGWWIREIGLYDSAGDLIAIANCAETYKPLLQEGSGRVQVIRVILIVSSTQAITLKIDPSVVLATRQYVDDAIIEVKTYVDTAIKEHAESRNHPDATLKEKGFVQLSSATNSTSESLAATPKAVKAANDNANDRLSTANNLSEIKAAGSNAQLAAQGNIGLVEYGIAPALKSQTGTDLNTVMTQGVSVVTNPINGPVDGSAGTIFLRVLTWQSGTGVTGYRAVQEVMGYGQSGSTGNRVWRRTWTGSIWSGWIEFYSQARKPTAEDVGALTRADAPVGIPYPWPTASAPTGWLKCNGSTFDKAKYPLLAVAYPSGKLPDLRGEFIRGWDDGRSVDSGRTLLEGQADSFRSHIHKITAWDAWDASVMTPNDREGDLLLSTDNAISSGGSINGKYNDKYGTVSNGGDETRPRNIAFNYIVRAA